MRTSSPLATDTAWEERWAAVARPRRRSVMGERVCPSAVTASLLVDVLTYPHVLSATGWLGGSLLFLTVIGAILPRLSPPARNEVVAALLPRFARAMMMFGVATLVWGIALAAAIASPNYSQLNASNPWGLYITIGALLAIAAALVGSLLSRSHVTRLADLARNLRDHPESAPPDEMNSLRRRVVREWLVGIVLLLGALVAMVAAAGA